jgi:hypothetical protein
MKTKYFIASIALISALQVGAQNKSGFFNRIKNQANQGSRAVNEFLPTFEKQFVWNTELSIWDSVAIRNYVYFESNLDTVNIGDPVNNEYLSREIYSNTAFEDVIVTQALESGSWVNMQKTVDTRDNQGYSTGNQFYLWQNDDWVLQFGERYLTTYDGSNNLVGVESQSWDGNTQSWLTYTNILASYEGNLRTQLIFQEPSMDGTLEDFIRIELAYQAGSTEADTALLFLFQGGNWLLQNRFLIDRWINYNNFETFEPVSYTEQEFLDGSFVDVSRQVRNDLDNGGYFDLGEDFDGLAWVLSYRFTLLIDDKGNTVEEKSEFYSDGEVFIEYANLFTYTYDSNDNILERVQQFYNINTNEYQFNNRSVFGAYLDVTGIELIGEESFTIFPNPTDGLLNLSSKHQIEQVRIFDLHGRMVKQELSNQRQMNVSDLDVGLYFIQATINKQLVSTRFVKQ